MFDAASASDGAVADASGGGQARPPALVQVRGLKMYFPIYAGLLRRRVGEVKAVF